MIGPPVAPAACSAGDQNLAQDMREHNLQEEQPPFPSLQQSSIRQHSFSSHMLPPSNWCLDGRGHRLRDTPASGGRGTDAPFRGAELGPCKHLFLALGFLSPDASGGTAGPIDHNGQGSVKKALHVDSPTQEHGGRLLEKSLRFSSRAFELGRGGTCDLSDAFPWRSAEATESRGLIPHSFQPSLFSNTCFPMFFGGFLERFGSLERMDMGATLGTMPNFFLASLPHVSAQ